MVFISITLKQTAPLHNSSGAVEQYVKPEYCYLNIIWANSLR